jgi:hypothetical protein
MYIFAAPKGKINKGNKLEGTIPDLEALVAAKASYEKALRAIEAAKVAITIKGEKLFKLKGNLLCDKAQQPWEKSSRPK